MTSPEPLDEKTRQRLAAQARVHTGPELELRRELWSRGLRYRLHRSVPGTRRTIDIAFVEKRVAVFVDGCFWHGCPRHGSTPRNNSRWWREKIETNRARDADTNRRLKNCGWKVVRIWEHEPTSSAAARVQRAVESRDTRRRADR